MNRESEIAESLEEEDHKLLESLVSEGQEISEEGHQPKRPRQDDSGSDPSSSNTRAVTSNSAVSAGSVGASAGGVNSPVDFSRLPFWDSSLVDLFSSEGVDPLVLGDLGSGGGTP